MTPAEIIADARIVLNDTDATSPRQDDDELLGWVNAGLLEIANFKPVLFAEIIDFTCAASAARQVVPLSEGSQIIEVIGIKNGAALTVFDPPTLNAYNPGWRTQAGTPEQWAPVPADPLEFDLVPPPNTAVHLDVRVARTPGPYALTDTILLLPDTYKPALVDYVTYRAELKDDENVLTQRSAAMYTAFLTKIGATNGSSGQ